jgi:hypothetical protein
MVPEKAPFERAKKLVQGGGNTYDAEHGAISRLPLAGGRWVHSFTINGWIASPAAIVKPSTRFSPEKISQLEKHREDFIPPAQLCPTPRGMLAVSAPCAPSKKNVSGRSNGLIRASRSTPLGAYRNSD